MIKCLQCMFLQITDMVKFLWFAETSTPNFSSWWQVGVKHQKSQNNTIEQAASISGDFFEESNTTVR